MNGAGEISKRLEPLSESLASARQSDRDRYGRFFTALGARLDSARAVERELNRLLARRFNALDYLRTDELGLSRIIADLLDPGGPHGQGACFLARFGDLVGPDRWPVDPTARYEGFEVEVVRERGTDDGGFLDISVELRAPGREPACVAFENKPYAADGEAQIADYLKFLRHHYGSRFLLIYLSGHGGMPSESSLSQDACKDGLATMSFCPRTAADECEDNLLLRLPFSLSDWLRGCRQICDAERLRWFLREVETFCHNTFGGIVTTTSEQKEVRDFILANDDNVLTAIAVIDTWGDTRDKVVKRFLEVLRVRIDADLHTIDGFHDLQTGSDFTVGGGGGGGLKNGVWAFRKVWSDTGRAVPLVSLKHEGHAKNWFLGVGLNSGTGDADAEQRLKSHLRQRLDEQPALRGTIRSPTWPWYRYLEEHRDWWPLLARLHKESQNQSGDLIDHFSRQFVEVAELAIPIIDKVMENPE